MLVTLNVEKTEKFRKDFLEELINSEDYFDEIDSSYSYDLCDKDMFLGWKINGEIKCVCMIGPLLKNEKLSFLKDVNEVLFDLIVNYENVKFGNDMLNEIAKLYPNICLYKSDTLFYETYKDSYNLLTLESSYKENIEEDYDVILSEELLISKYNKTNFQEEFNNINCIKSIETIEYKIMGRNELKCFMSDEDGWKNNIIDNYGNINFMGFHYFSPSNLSSFGEPKNLKFIVCIVNNNTIAGVLKLGSYGSIDFEYVGLNYIDVHIGYRRKGIAKGLYKALNYFLDENTVLISSDLSTMGKEAKLSDLRNKCVTKFKTYNNMSDYYEKEGVGCY